MGVELELRIDRTPRTDRHLTTIPKERTPDDG
jgi:hypothetical protein